MFGDPFLRIDPAFKQLEERVKKLEEAFERLKNKDKKLDPNPFGLDGHVDV